MTTGQGDGFPAVPDPLRTGQALDELAAEHPELGIPTELEALSWAARECGDAAAGRMADELARGGEWGES